MPNEKNSAMGNLPESVIRRQLLSETVQQPATLLPLAIAIMSVSYLLLLSPVFGGRLWAVALILVSGIVATTNFVWQYVFRYREEYARRIREQMDRLGRERERLERAELRQLSEALKSGFSSIDFDEGIKGLSELVDEYEQLQLAVRFRVKIDPRFMFQIPELVEETYRRGLSALSDALELMKAVQTPSRERLVKEIVELEKEMEASQAGEDRADWLRIEEDMLASHRQRLGMLDQLRLGVDHLLHQAGRCEASLHRTRIELAAISAGGWVTDADSVIEALQGTITQVKEVQKELKRLGY